ncbi:hypothetical protein V8G54_006142 [Vigna mungo]|uniref:Uncharacterized protein n=1 Tax=Vigna mungo TaxID=3915 RepID=A0AAQ3P0L9_VIGMU
MKHACDTHLASLVLDMDDAVLLIEYGLEETAYLLVAACLQVFLRDLLLGNLGSVLISGWDFLVAYLSKFPTSTEKHFDLHHSVSGSSTVRANPRVEGLHMASTTPHDQPQWELSWTWKWILDLTSFHYMIVKYNPCEMKWGETIEDDSSLLGYANHILRLMNHFIVYSLPLAEKEQEDEEKVTVRIDFMINDVRVIQQHDS